MYKTTLEQAQEFINALQVRPYKDVYQIVDAILKSQKDAEGNFVFSLELVQALQNYLATLPYAEVHQVIQLTAQLEKVETPNAEQQEGFSTETVDAQPAPAPANAEVKE